MSLEDREKLISGDLVLDETTLRLQQTQKAALEAEQMSQNIYEQLRQQRERIENSARALHSTDADMDQSNQLLNEIIARYSFQNIAALVKYAFI